MNYDALKADSIILASNPADCENYFIPNNHISPSLQEEPSGNDIESEGEVPEHSSHIMSPGRSDNDRNSNNSSREEGSSVQSENEIRQGNSTQQLTEEAGERGRGQNIRFGNTSNNNRQGEERTNNVQIITEENINTQQTRRNRPNRRTKKIGKKNRGFKTNLNKFLNLLDHIYIGSDVKHLNLEFNKNF